MAVPNSVIFSDDFNRADENPIAGYTKEETSTATDPYQIVSNQLVYTRTAGGGITSIFPNGVTLISNAYRVIFTEITTTGGQFGCWLRKTGSGATLSGYRVYRNGWNYEVQRWINGVATQIDSFFVGFDNLSTQTWTVEIEDDINGDPVITTSTISWAGRVTTDSDVNQITAIGQIGLNGVASVTWDNLEIQGDGGASNANIDYYLHGNPAPTTVTITCRSPAGLATAIEYSVNSDFTASVTTSTQVGVAGTDFVLRFDIAGLIPNTTYYFRGVENSVVDQTPRQFRTGVTKGTQQSLEVFFAGCANTSSTHDVFDRARARNPDLILQLGDFHYTDILTNDVAVARQAYKDQFASVRQRQFYESAHLAYTFDDHDAGINNADGSHPGIPAAQQAIREIFPQTRRLSSGSLESSFYWGRVFFIMLDVRSNRAANDVLGAAQEAWLLAELTAAASDPDVALIVVDVTVPWIATNVTDTWSHSSDQRTRIADHIWAQNLQGKILFIASDAHMNAHDDGTNNVFDTQGRTGWPVYQSGSLDRIPSTKGGPYTGGTFPGIGQYSMMSIADDGVDITVTTTAYSETDAVQFTHVANILAPRLDTVPTQLRRGSAGNQVTFSGAAPGHVLGEVSATLGGQVLNVSNLVYVDADTIRVDLEVPNNIALLHEPGYTLIVTVTGDGDWRGTPVELLPPTGWSVVDVVDPVLVGLSIYVSYLGDDPVTGDETRHSSVSSPDNLAVTLDQNGYVAFDPAPTRTQTVDYVVAQADGTQGTLATYTYTLSDIVPDSFTLVDQTNVPVSTAIESNAITLTGMDAGVDSPIAVTGGEYAVSTDGGANFGAYTSAAGNVQLNYQVKVRVTSSASNSTAVNAQLTIGGVADTFTVTTGAGADTTPPVFTAGPTIADLTPTSVNVNFTSNESGTGATLVVAQGQPRPSDTAFDAVAASIAAGASTQQGHAGLTPTAPYTVWAQLVDLASNRTTVSTNFSTPAVPDTTPPVVTAPADITLQFQNGGAGLAHSDAALQTWLALATATDETAPASPAVTNDLASLPDPIPASVRTITFSAQDAANNVGQAAAQLTVEEAPVSTTPPAFADQSFTVVENSAIGTSIGFLAATADNPITYAILSGNVGNALALDANTGELTVSGSIDYQTLNAYTLTVEATANAIPVMAAVTVYVGITTQHDLINIDAFYPGVRAEITQVATALLAYHARETLKDFCKRSRFWQEFLPELTVRADEARYGVNPPTGTVISAFVEAKTVDSQGKEVDLPRTNQDIEQWAFFQISNTVIELQYVEEFAPGPVTLKAALIPAPDATQVSQDIFNQYHETIVSGIKGRLFGMAGQTWSDSNKAIENNYQFEEGVNDALQEAARGYSDLPEPITRKPRDFF